MILYQVSLYQEEEIILSKSRAKRKLLMNQRKNKVLALKAGSFILLCL
jgi:hypothetical protein